jgi:hypothetical protein
MGVAHCHRSAQKRGEAGASTPAMRAPQPGDGGAEAGPDKRVSAQRKLGAVQRPMRGESPEALSRALNGPAHRLSARRAGCGG